MVKKLKIAIFHLGFFFSGGGERLVIEEAKGLLQMGHQVEVYVPIIDAKRCFPDLLGHIKIKRLFINLPIKFPLRDFIAICGSIFLIAFTAFRFRQFDIFIGANQPGPLLCYILAKLLHKPYLIYLAQPTRIIYPRQIDKEVGFGKGSFNLFYITAKIFHPIIKKLDKISIINAGKVLVNGSYIAQAIKKIYGVKTLVCPAGTRISRSNFTDSRFSGKIRIKKRYYPKPYILLTNRHFPQKKFEFVIRSTPFILEKFPQVKIIITGAFTKYTHNLIRLTEKLNLQEKIFFINYLNEAELELCYKNAAVYVYTAPEEDFGMGVIEAMGYGIPVVAWNSGGPATTVIHRKTGFLIPPFDVTKFTSAIIRLLKNSDLNRIMGLAARNHVLKNYLYRNHLDILNSALQNTFKSYYAN